MSMFTGATGTNSLADGCCCVQNDQCSGAVCSANMCSSPRRRGLRAGSKKRQVNDMIESEELDEVDFYEVEQRRNRELTMGMGSPSENDSTEPSSSSQVSPGASASPSASTVTSTTTAGNG
jgi:hypothetical protein